jgi:hypothetical protein
MGDGAQVLPSCVRHVLGTAPASPPAADASSTRHIHRHMGQRIGRLWGENRSVVCDWCVTHPLPWLLSSPVGCGAILLRLTFGLLWCPFCWVGLRRYG